MGENRTDYIDCIKGFGIVLVVLGHIDQGEHFLCQWIYSFHMPLFFIVSGMLMAIKPQWENISLCNTIKKKATQLLWPYITFSIAAFFLLLIMGKREMAVQCIEKTVLFEGYSSLWYLPCLFFGECIFVILYKSKIKTGIWLALIFIAAWCGTEFCGTYKTSEYLVLINFITRIMIGITFLMSGYCGIKGAKRIIVVLKDKINRNFMIGLAVLLCSINLIFASKNAFVDLHYSKVNNFFLYYICAYTGAMSAILFMKYLVIKNQTLVYLGRNSLIILVTHLPFPVLQWVKNLIKINTGMRYVDDIIKCISVILIEVIIIILINKCGKFMIKYPFIMLEGRKSKKFL